MADLATNAEIREDLEWLRAHLTGSVLPCWLAAAPTPEGLFLPQRDRHWRLCGEPVGTIVSQSRLLYSFSCGCRVLGADGYGDAVAFDQL